MNLPILLVDTVERKTTFRLASNYSIFSPFHKEMVSVPSGYKTNGATIPLRFFWIFISPQDLIIPHIAHDYLYETGNLHQKPKERIKADKLLRHQCKQVGIGVIRRNIIYFTVRLLGVFPSLYRDK